MCAWVCVKKNIFKFMTNLKYFNWYLIIWIYRQMKYVPPGNVINILQRIWTLSSLAFVLSINIFFAFF